MTAAQPLAAIIRTDEEARHLFAEAVRTSEVLACVPGFGPFERPDHLASVADVFERAEAAARGEGPPVFACISAPPQTGKTTLAKVAMARWLKRRPQDLLGWLTYQTHLAEMNSADVRDMTRELLVPLRDDTQSKQFWRTTDGGGLVARGMEAGVTGLPGLKLLLIDDPYADREQALSRAHRRTIRDRVQAVVFTRRNPQTSIVVVHTRWATDDLIGWLMDEYPDLFELHRIPAINDQGEPVVTLGGRNADFWQTQKRLMGPMWEAMALGLPRPAEGGLFKQDRAPRYQHKPNVGRVCIGIDMAYSSKTGADYSVAVVLMREDERCYVLDVVREQCDAPAWAERLAALKARWPAAPIRWYTGGQEAGIVAMMRTRGVHITATPAKHDKVVRAQATAAAWNDGLIALPESAAWIEEFADELGNFPSGGHDDQVDALVAAFDGLPFSRDSGLVQFAAARGGLSRQYEGAAPSAGQAANQGWRPGDGVPRRRWE